MAKKRKQRGAAATATEVPEKVTGERGSTEAGADPVAPRKTRRGLRSGDAEKVVAVAELDAAPVASAVASDSGGRTKPKLKKRKNSKHDQSSCATSGKGCPDVETQVSVSPSLTEDARCPEGNLVPEGKKPQLKKRKKRKHEQPPSAISDDATAVVAGSGNSCKNGEGATADVAVETYTSGNICNDGEGASGDVGVSLSPINRDEPDRPEVNTREQGTQERKKTKVNKQRKNKQVPSPSAAMDADAIAVAADESGNDFPDEKGALGDVEVNMNPRNGGDTDRPAVNIGEKEIPEMKKPKRKKRKKNKQEQSSSAVSDTGAIVTDKSGNDFPDEKGLSGDLEVSMNPRNGGDRDHPVVNIGEEIPKMNKPKRKKRKRNKQGQSSSAVSDTGAIVTDRSGNDSPDEKGASGDIEVNMNPIYGGDTDRPGVNIGEKETPEMKKPKRKKRKKNKQGQSSSAVSDTGAIVTDRSGNDSPDEKGASGDIEVSMNPIYAGDTDRPGVNIGEKETPEMNKPKRKKRKKNKQGQSSSAVSDAGAVVTDRSRNSSTNEEVTPGDVDVNISPRNENDPNIPNAPEDLVEEKQGNEENSQRPKRRKHKKERKIDQVIVTVAPVVDVPSTGLIEKMDDEKEPDLLEAKEIKESMGPSICDSEVAGKNVSLTLVQGTEANEKAKDVCIQAETDKSDFIFNAPTSGGNHKEKVQDIYSSRGSLVRFQRKKLLILDLNGLLADINQDRRYAHLAHAKVRGKLVFKRPYYDDFLKFCFQHFEVAIWSSRMKMNVDSVVDILMKDLKQHLLFCWDRSQCTTTGSNTLENRDKPIVFKELKKVWNKEQPNLPWEEGEFSPSNTLLVDDSPYKALRNPPHTAIFPYPYSHLDKNDDLLGPRGDLRVYLENLAGADNVQSYVRDHPFGQPFLAEGDPNWHFYVQVLDKVNMRAA